MIERRLPYPPSTNHYWRRVGPRTLISREGRAFRQEVERRVRREKGLHDGSPLEGDLLVIVLLFPPDRRRRDIDNTLKALLDALQHAGVYGDDSQIVKLEIKKEAPREGGQTIVRVGRFEQKGDSGGGDD